MQYHLILNAFYSQSVCRFQKMKINKMDLNKISGNSRNQTDIYKFSKTCIWSKTVWRQYEFS